MYKKIKSYFLMPNIDPVVLERFGYEKYGKNYSKQLKKDNDDIRYYGDTRRFVYISYPLKDARGKKVKKYIKELIKIQIVELKVNYEWWNIIGSWHKYSKEKIDKIQKKLDELNKEII